MALLAVFCLLLPACNGSQEEPETDPVTGEQTTAPADTAAPDDETDTEENTTTGAEEITEPETEFIPVPIDPSVYSIDHAGSKNDIVLLASDFGVVGDGVTDDGPAICRAVNAAIEQQATLRFESGKTFRVLTASNKASVFTSPLAFSGASGVTVDGGGSVFCFKPGINFFAINGSSNIRLCNMKFDLTESPYLVGTVKGTNGNTVTFTTDREPYVDSYNYSGATSFSIAYNEGIQNRPHRFITSMKKTASCEVEIVYRDGAPGYRQGDKVFIPNPGIGHVYSESVYIGYCGGAMTFENIEIWAASSFVFAIKDNECEMYFQNVDLVPGEQNDREIKMVSWRDGYHCKDNRLPLHWDKCEADVLFDDVFNISGTLGYVTGVSNENRVTVTNYEFYTRGMMVGYNCRVGDVVDIYNPSKARFCGSATVREVIGNPNGTVSLVLDYGVALKDITEGCVVGNRETCAPGSTITDCHFTGTFRFLRNLRVERTVFDLLLTWTKVEGGVEGPLPGNIDYIDCTFNGGTLEIGNTGRKICDQIKDIGFWNCTFNNTQKSFFRGVTVTEADTWTEADLFTVKNRKTTFAPVVPEPNTTDLMNTATYDWTRYTMPVKGGRILAVESLSDAELKQILAGSPRYADNVLVLTGTEAQNRFLLGGLTADLLPEFHKDGATYIITISYYTTAEGGAMGALAGETAVPLNQKLFTETARISEVAVLYGASGKNTELYIEVPVGATVYIGQIAVTAASYKNPTTDQLENGHTFVWSDDLTIGERGEILRVDEIKDETVKAAIKGAESGFTSGVILHLKRGLGAFTGLTNADYYIPGKTYHLSLDAYIASPIQPADTKIYLLAMDDTPGNRVLAEGILTGEGLYHFEMDWTVGNTGEKSLNFYISGTPSHMPDIYMGDFTISVAKSLQPDIYLDRSDYHTLTAEDVKNGYTFDFTEGKLLDIGRANYTSTATLPTKVATLLTENGYGDTLLYINQNFTFNSLPDDLTGGGRLKITMQVYDILGNLATSGSRGVFVMLHMQGGVQNSGEVNYKVEVSEADSRLLTLTFEGNPPSGTDDLLFYQLSTMEFFIGSVTIEKA